MELLCPAGNLLAAYSAFKGGADAIYVGGKRFSARASADNFSNEDLTEIVDFAHSIGKKVYVTLNTLLFQDEFMDAVEFANFLYQINIDGLIVQDLGLANYLHKTLPDLPLNASTQLNCHNIDQAKALVKLGFKRIVLARETNLDFAKKVKDLGVEVEVFGHGALCVSYSGNCLLSSFIGNRSGNRGRCAQPCRMKYDLLENGNLINSSFTISTKDLMSLDYLQDFFDAGVDSLKIEGRLKSNEYIYTVSKAYRNAIDSLIENRLNKDARNDKINLIKIFNREFTKGFVENESPFTLLNQESSSHQGQIIGRVVNVNKNRITIQLTQNIHRLDGIRFVSQDFESGLTIEKMFLNKNPVEEAFIGQKIEIANVDSASRLLNLEVLRSKDYLLNKQIENELKEKIKVNIVGYFNAHLNNQISLKVSFDGIDVIEYGQAPLEATGQGTSEERIKDQLSKTGDFPYQFKEINFEMERCFIPISEINDLRNRCLEKLRNNLIKRNPLKLNEYSSNVKVINSNTDTACIVETKEQAEILHDKVLKIYSEFDKNNKIENRVVNDLRFNESTKIMNFFVENPANVHLIANEYCNITNSYALDCYYEFGFEQCILSNELDHESIKLLITDFENRHNQKPNVGLTIYGKVDAMILKSCPIGTVNKNKTLHCNKCHVNRYELVDRIGEKYHLLGDSICTTRLLNNRPTYLLDFENEIDSMGISTKYLRFTDENEEKVSEIITHYLLNDGKFSNVKHTRGRYQKRPL